MGHYLEKTPLDDLGVSWASSRRSLFDPFGGFGRFSILGNSRMVFSHSLVHASMISRTIKLRASVVECGDKPWRDTVASRRAFFGLITFFPHSTAVSSMQGALASLPPH